MNKRLQLQVRQPGCTLCPMHRGTEIVCQTGDGPLGADVMVVSKMPNSKSYQAGLESYLDQAGLDPDTVLFTSALKCRNFDHQPGRADVKACRAYLDRELEVVKPAWVLALGNEALQALTGRSGIMKYRGRVFKRDDVRIMATLSYSMIQARPGYTDGFIADLNYFAAMVENRRAGIPEPNIRRIDTKEKLQRLGRLIEQADLVSYDIETTGPTEFAEGSAIVSMGITVVKGNGILNAFVPLFHPESVWQNNWVRIITWLVRKMLKVKKRVAQNGKFDDRWLWHFSGLEIHETFDTLIASHVLDENKPKGLKPMARMRLGVAPWEIETKSLLNTPLDTIQEYNGRDSYYTYHVYLQLREELKANPRAARIFVNIVMPANNLYTGIERHGMYIDPKRLVERSIQARATLEDFNTKLMEWVPDNIPQHLPRKRKKVVINFNPSNFARWLLFEHLGLPVLKRGKAKPDGSPGNPSMAEDVLLELRDEHPIVRLLLERAKWQKYVSTYFTAYEAQIDNRSRIHTTFKVWGTTTGRTSSGKQEAEKIAARVDIRGVNVQQVPRDPFIRGLYGVPDGWTFVEADFSQVELRVVAFLSRDPTMLRLYQTGSDIHLATASWVLGKPPSQITKEDRKKAKAVNFGFVYGMGAKKFVYTAFTKYDLRFSLEEAGKIRRTFFEQFSGLPEWHARQRRAVHKHGRVSSPLGRVRHLPDVYSTDEGVVREAERQAINSPVQSFASDMTLLAMAEVARQFQEQGIKAHILGTVHDALNVEAHNDHVLQAATIMQNTMENLPLGRKFGVHLDVPIVADLKVGRHWGDLEEVTLEDLARRPSVGSGVL